MFCRFQFRSGLRINIEVSFLFVGEVGEKGERGNHASINEIWLVSE